jgi:hypothetical protein
VHACQIADDALNCDFTGHLAAYKKGDLKALAIAIGVSDKGANGEPLARILEHFKQHLNLQHNPRFRGLFNKSICAPQRKGPKGAAVPSNREGGGHS